MILMGATTFLPMYVQGVLTARRWSPALRSR